jgi:hypothetical protein
MGRRCCIDLRLAMRSRLARQMALTPLRFIVALLQLAARPSMTAIQEDSPS